MTYIKALVIIPAYNEEESIRRVIENIKNENAKIDILVVNDGSKDKTSDEVRGTKVALIELPYNLGIGGAVQTGYIYAYMHDYDIAIQIDGDGQHNPSYIKNMIELVTDQNFDMVIGSRFIEKTSYKQTFFRKFGNRIIFIIIYLFTGKKIYDTTSGFRCVNKKIIKMFKDSYPYDYPEPDTNLQVILKKYKIKEIPVEMDKRTTGKSFASPINSIKYMLKVTLALFIARIRKA